MQVSLKQRAHHIIEMRARRAGHAGARRGRSPQLVPPRPRRCEHHPATQDVEPRRVLAADRLEGGVVANYYLGMVQV